jgi:hypothetical protein
LPIKICAAMAQKNACFFRTLAHMRSSRNKRPKPVSFRAELAGRHF